MKLLHRRDPVHDFADIIYQLGVFLSTGITPSDAIQIIAAGYKSSYPKKLLATFSKDLEQGKKLSDCLARHPRFFKPFMVDMVRSASTEELPKVLQSIGELLESIHIDKKKIKSAFAYPLILFFCAIIIFYGLMVFVVPQFSNMFTSFGGVLPAPTQLLIMVSSFIDEIFLALMIGIAIIYLGSRYAERKFFRITQIRSKIIQHTPIWGQLHTLRASLVFVRTVVFILTIDRSLTSALEAAAETMPSLYYQELVKGIKEKMLQGKTLAGALNETNALSAQITSAASVAEANPGVLMLLFARLGDKFYIQTQDIIENMTPLLSRMLLVVLGVVIGYIVIALYLPIFRLAALVG